MKKVFICIGMALSAGVFLSCNCNNKCQPREEKAGVTVQDSVLKESQDPLTKLVEGNERFYTGKARHVHQDTIRANELENGQSPFAIVVSCSDSRVPPEIVFDQGLGDIFSVRTAGNVMSDYELGSIEYAAEHLGTKLIVVMGHEGCGAVKAFLEHEKDDNVPGHIHNIVQALKDEVEEKEVLKTRENLLPRAVRANVRHGVTQLQNSEPLLKEMFQKGEIKIVGAVYHLESGKVEFPPQ